MSTISIDPRLAERVLESIHAEELVDLARQLIQIPTVNPPGDVTDAAFLCTRYLAEAGFTVELDAGEETKPNVIARYGTRPGPTLLWNSHLDVVPIGEESAWSVPPFAGTVQDGRIYGRGACDVKGGVAAQLVAAAALVRSGIPLHGSLIVTEVADEEVGGRLGAARIAAREDLRPDAVMVAEPTQNRVCVGERGGVGIRVTVFGRTAHGALPWEGVNAIEGMARVITALQHDLWPRLAERRHPYFAPASATISLIEGGVKTNVVPDRCSIYIDRRLIPGEEPEMAVEEVREIAERAVAATPGLRVIVEAAPEWPGRRAIVQPEDSPLVRTMVAVNRYLGLDTTLTGFSMGTDGRFFATRGYPTIIYGPGDPRVAHQPDEWVAIDDLVQCARAYALAGLAILGPQSSLTA
ncbi:M20 family metallopeptidase [Thermomicrobium sp. 4228-Ro]|uniref:M20 family metallopeptidase n=1 Tax=Thermomicrobium sp. 4228-Ro TaxID=2993937 RepID=UPI0022490775|nr:M20 family metallopeptidase [Thermomicrobium sp. 4228-Ro]MCX2727656.1 M20 family metallopeptidase [Thermomicrobium sp. 4228-Ro]